MLNDLNGKHLGLKLMEKELTLPMKHWIPKMQKNPVRAYFIIIASKLYFTKHI